MKRIAFLLCIILLGFPAARGQTGSNVVFMEPAETTGGGGLPAYRVVSDPQQVNKYAAWLRNDSARMAFDLYERAWAAVRKRDQTAAATPPYHIALVPRGNHADAGFRLISDSGTTEHPRLAYIKLGPQRSRFGNTLLHETGHVVLRAFSGGQTAPARPIASIPHTTAALSNRGTAFNEGFAIHLETLDVHLRTDEQTRRRYRHERFAFGGTDWRSSEYYTHATDLRSFSQSIARYYEVRENNFAFAAAFKGPYYLRVQLEKSRDFATLRDANQLLQSEGFYASFFFGFTVRGDGLPSREVVSERREKMLAALAEMFVAHPPTSESPYLLNFVESYMRLYPDEAGEIVGVLLDLSHGVFVDAEAAEMWRAHYLGALRLDLKNLQMNRINDARARWRSALLKDPQVLYTRLGPQLPCRVSSQTVRLVALGGESPLAFDLNTAQEGIIRMIPGISDAEVDRWIVERAERPYVDVGDFKQRGGLRVETLAHLRF